MECSVNRADQKGNSIRLIKFTLFKSFEEINFLNDDIIEKLPVFLTTGFAAFLHDNDKVESFWVAGFDEIVPKMLVLLTIRRKLWFREGRFVSRIFWTNESVTVSEEREFLQEMIRFLKSQNIVDWIAQSANWVIFRAYPEGSSYCDFGTYLKRLSDQDEDELFQSIDTKDRSDIRYAIKNNVIVNSKKFLSIQELLIINQTNQKAGQKPYDINYFESMTDLIYDNIVVFSASQSGIIQCVAVFIYDKNCIYNFISGTIPHSYRGSNSLLYWEALKWACKNGIKLFDFVGARINPIPGSKQERIQRFKKHFGVELETGYLWKIAVNKNRYYLYNFLLKFVFFIRRRKPRLDIIDQEKDA